MRISAIAVGGVGGWPALQLDAVAPGLNVVYGPTGSGKSTAANVLAHSLFGGAPAFLDLGGQRVAPPGEVHLIDRHERRFRVRRFHDGAQSVRLALAALDGSDVDEKTMGTLVGGFSPTVLTALCAVSFREPPALRKLLSPVFAREYQAVCGSGLVRGSRRLAELAARRDQLAQELEARIGGERRASGELEARWRELDRSIRDQQQQSAALEQRLRAVETSLAETDARLRYRRLELNVDLQWQKAATPDLASPRGEVEEQIARTRSMLAELAHREASVRARLAEIAKSPHDSAAALADQRAWLSVARQLSADLTGEVARLARSSGSEQCVCRDAHPRLRPISETIGRQLDVLQSIVDVQHRAGAAAALEMEIQGLTAAQGELRRCLDHLLRQQHTHVAASQPATNGGAAYSLSAADAEQLESRRIELEQERFRLTQQSRSHARQLRDLRAARETVDRQRAALLSARSIEHVQRELAAVQQKLEYAAGAGSAASDPVITAENPARASDFLAQLTDGGLVRLALTDGGRRAQVVNRAGEALPVESLAAGERDLVYVSLCLALLSAAAQHGTWLPLVLDEPFARLDARATAALAAVLDDFARQGHQVIVFTGQLAASERLAFVGATRHDMVSLRAAASPAALIATTSQRQDEATRRSTSAKVRKAKRRKGSSLRGEPGAKSIRDGIATDDGHSDAA